MPLPRPLAQHIATRQRRPDLLIGNLWLPNPDPILKKLGRDIEAYRELRSDAHTGGCIRRRKAAVKAMEWRIERDKASARMHRLVQGIFEQLDLGALINDIMEAVLYGYQPLEILWQQRTGQAPAVQRIIGKPPEWFLFDSEARLRFKSREHPLHGELLPERKFLLARQEASYANPYGFADLSMCFWPVTFKRGGMRFWFKFAEKYGMPWAVGKQPRNSPQPESDRLLEQLEAMIEDAVAVIPDDASVEMIQATSSNGNASAYENLLMFCRSEVAIALLGQNQSTEADSTHASAMAGLGVTYELRDGDKRLVEGVLNSQLIRWIVDLHEGEAAPPRALNSTRRSKSAKPKPRGTTFSSVAACIFPRSTTSESMDSRTATSRWASARSRALGLAAAASRRPALPRRRRRCKKPPKPNTPSPPSTPTNDPTAANTPSPPQTPPPPSSPTGCAASSST